MTDLTFKTKKAAIMVAKFFAERNGEGYCVLPLINAHSKRISSYRICSFSDWIKDCQEVGGPINVTHFVRR